MILTVLTVSLYNTTDENREIELYLGNELG